METMGRLTGIEPATLGTTSPPGPRPAAPDISLPRSPRHSFNYRGPLDYIQVYFRLHPRCTTARPLYTNPTLVDRSPLSSCSPANILTSSAGSSMPRMFALSLTTAKSPGVRQSNRAALGGYFLPKKRLKALPRSKRT